MFNLYNYQEEAFKTTLNKDKGVICMPTGSGKTRIEAAIISNSILENKSFKIYTIVAPKIVLSYQLQLEFYKFFLDQNIEARYFFLHSGGFDNYNKLEEFRKNTNIAFSQIESGTTIDQIKSFILKSKKQNLPLIIISTYHSINRLELARRELNLEVEITVCDEAHYLVQREFYNNFLILNSKRKFFFTATPLFTNSSKSRGMNNKDFYGDFLYEMPPKLAIDLGKAVRPRLHLLKSIGIKSEKEYLDSIAFIIYDAFISHFKILLKTVEDETRNKRILMNPKLLVSVKGSKDILKFKKSHLYESLLKYGVNIFITHSNEKLGNFINDKKVSRNEFLNILRDYGKDPNKKLIVLHYDILSEGIDVDGFTGVLLLRNLRKSKLIQTIGRCSRLEYNDRIILDKNKNTPLYMLNKPYTYILIPKVTLDNLELILDTHKVIKQLRKSYIISPDDVIITDTKNGITDSEELKNLNFRALFIRNENKVGELITELEKEQSFEADESDYEEIKNSFEDIDKIIKLEKEIKKLNEWVSNFNNKNKKEQLTELNNLF